MMSTFIAHDSINLMLSALKEGKGVGVGGGGGVDRKKVIRIKEKDTWWKVVQRTGRFSDICGTLPRNLLPPIVCRRTFQSLGNRDTFLYDLMQ